MFIVQVQCMWLNVWEFTANGIRQGYYVVKLFLLGQRQEFQALFVIHVNGED